MGILHCTARSDWLKDQSPLSSHCCVVGAAWWEGGPSWSRARERPVAPYDLAMSLAMSSRCCPGPTARIPSAQTAPREEASSRRRGRAAPAGQSTHREGCSPVDGPRSAKAHRPLRFESRRDRRCGARGCQAGVRYPAVPPANGLTAGPSAPCLAAVAAAQAGPRDAGPAGSLAGCRPGRGARRASRTPSRAAAELTVCTGGPRADAAWGGVAAGVGPRYPACAACIAGPQGDPGGSGLGSIAGQTLPLPGPAASGPGVLRCRRLGPQYRSSSWGVVIEREAGRCSLDSL
jgi:hypothetical protein